jgi:hypothetical protein
MLAKVPHHFMASIGWVDLSRIDSVVNPKRSLTLRPKCVPYHKRVVRSDRQGCRRMRNAPYDAPENPRGQRGTPKHPFLLVSRQLRASFFRVELLSSSLPANYALLQYSLSVNGPSVESPVPLTILASRVAATATKSVSGNTVATRAVVANLHVKRRLSLL